MTPSGADPFPVPPDPSFPSVPVEYHQLLRTPRMPWWKGALLIASFLVGYLILSVVFQGAAIVIDLARGRVQLSDVLATKITLTPVLLLGVNLTNAACIPLALLLRRAFSGQPVRWLHSVTGRFRWRILGWSAVVVAPIWALYLVLALWGAPSGRFTSESVAFLIVVVLTTPLQSAGEEYGARGLLMQAAGSWAGSRWLSLAIGTGVSAVIFMLAHGAGDPWLIVFYFLFGVGQSVVTWRTGGLEAAVVTHSANNLVMFGAAILTGQDLSNALDRSDGSGGPAVLVPAAVLVIVTGAVCWWSSRRRPARVFGPERSRPEVRGVDGTVVS